MPKTSAEKMTALRERRRKAGLVRIELYVHKEMAAYLKFISKLPITTVVSFVRDEYKKENKCNKI